MTDIHYRSNFFYLYLVHPFSLTPCFFLKPLEMDSECVICCCPYDKRSHLEIKCSNCNHSACRTCHQTFLLDHSTEARCMHCNVGWSIIHLYRNFPNSFVVKFRHQQREALWNRELFHLPTLAEYVEHQRNHEKYGVKVENAL